MDHLDELPSTTPSQKFFHRRGGSFFSSFSEIRSLPSIHENQHKRPASTLFNADGVSISDGRGRPTTRDGALGRKFRNQSQNTQRSRIMDRGRNDYASYLKHTPKGSRGSARRGGFLDRDLADQASIRRYLPSVYEPPHFEVEQRLGNVVEERAKETRSGSGDGEFDEENEEARFWNRRRVTAFVHIFLGLLFTGWWLASVLLHRKDMNWVIPLLLWLAVMIRLVTFHVYCGWLLSPISLLWDEISDRIMEVIPRRFQHIISGVLVGIIIVAVAMTSHDFEDNTRVNRIVSLAGYALCIALLWATSRNRRMINWHTVIVGILLQFAIGIFVLRTKAGFNIFSWISRMCGHFLGFADSGLIFITDATVPALPWLAISIVPSIIFFAGIAQLLSYWGVLPWFVRKAATFFFWALQVSGVEAVVAATSPFLGQVEALLLIRPFLSHISNAELHQIMCSGFATIAGSVLAVYMNLGVNAEALLSSCVMSIPMSLVVSKLRYPEEEEPFTAQYLAISEINRNEGVTFMHAFTNGIWLGLKIAGIFLAALSSVIAVVALIDAFLTWWGQYINIGPSTPLTLELILNYLLFPVAFLLGVPRNGDLLKVSHLIGIKILKNEFVAFEALQTDPTYATLSSRTRLIATFSLCGFGNLGALGAQLGLLVQMAPGRSGDIARVAGSAWITGIISTLLSASMAAILITDQAALFSTTTVGLNTTLGNSVMNSTITG